MANSPDNTARNYEPEPSEPQHSRFAYQAPKNPIPIETPAQTTARIARNGALAKEEAERARQHPINAALAQRTVGDIGQPASRQDVERAMSGEFQLEPEKEIINGQLFIETRPGSEIFKLVGPAPKEYAEPEREHEFMSAKERREAARKRTEAEKEAAKSNASTTFVRHFPDGYEVVERERKQGRHDRGQEYHNNQGRGRR